MTHSSENIFNIPVINVEEIKLDFRFPQLSKISLISHLFLLDCFLIGHSPRTASKNLKI